MVPVGGRSRNLLAPGLLAPPDLPHAATSRRSQGRLGHSRPTGLGRLGSATILLARWWVTARRSAISMRRTVGVFVIKSLTVYGLPIRRTAARAVQPVVLPGLADGPWEVRRVVGASSPRLSGQSNQSKLPMQGTRCRHRCRARTPVARPDGLVSAITTRTSPVNARGFQVGSPWSAYSNGNENARLIMLH